MKKNIKLNATDYPVFIGNIFPELNKWIKSKKYSSVFILVDENTKKHCLPLLLNSKFQIPNSKFIQISSGESNKTLSTVEFIWTNLMEGKADRHSLLLNLGGGVITDIGGFAASTFKRGIDFVNIPTTLLCMADASIGGKTGIDFLQVKNSIGMIKNPAAVFVHPEFLKTLHEDEFKSGLAEMIKHALIEGGKTYAQTFQVFTAPVGVFTNRLLVKKTNNGSKVSNAQIAETIKTKLSVVKKDPEEKNVRRQLNFGHTIGHALESWMMEQGQNTFHGYCVAAGMAAELFLSEKLVGLKTKKKDETVNLLLQLFPKINFKEKDIDSIIRFMEQDKKNTSGKIGFVLMKKPGKMLIDQFVEKKQIREALLYYLSCFKNIN